ncbi:MAG: ACT domain-containing protein [Rikenellaceae bacterium]
MIIKQLSVFMENRVGVINEVTSILSKNGVNMQAFSVADGAEFGILRLIVSDLELAHKVLEEASYRVKISDVVCIKLPNVAGALSVVLETLAKRDVFIEYMYAFSEGEAASTIIRPTNVTLCEEILQANRSEIQAKSDLYTF